MHVAIITLGEWALVSYEAPRIASPWLEGVANFLIGPATSARIRLLIMTAVIMVSIIGVWKTVHLLTRDGSFLRETLNQLRQPNRKRGEMGSAHLCTPAEYTRFRQPDSDGITFLGAFWGQGKTIRKPLRLDAGDGRFCLSSRDIARGILTVGGPGSGKTQSIILPGIADWMRAGHPAIVVDPQNELTDYIRRIAGATGHQVIIHDPTSVTCPRFSLAADVASVSEARAIADVLLPVDPEGDKSGILREAAQTLLAACLIGYDSIGDIVLALSEPRELRRKIGAADIDTQLLAAPFLASFKDNRRFASEVIAVLTTSLTGWADEKVRQTTETSDFSAESLIGSKAVVVLTCPGRQRSVYARYLGAVLRKLMLDLDTIGESNGGELPVPVAIVLDEFPSLGKLDVLVSDVNLVRKRRISILISAQTKGQFHLIYGRSATDALFAGLATQIVFGGCDQETATFYSLASGMATETLSSKMGRPFQVRQRPLLTPDEIQAPIQGNATVFSRFVTENMATQVILLARLTRLYEREDWRELLEEELTQADHILSRPPVSELEM
jgi:type IV secretory pathway TraG/TraD family ATPase VirD4